jgi:hypothetical protein
VKCIFCLRERESSDEHVFPEAIGGTLHIERVCKCCNDRLGGYVDAPLVNHPLTIGLRWKFKIGGKGGTVPDALKQVLGTGRLAKDPSQRISASISSENQVPTIKLVPRQERTQKDGQDIVQTTIDYRDSPNLGGIIQKILTRAGKSPLPPSELAKEVARTISGAQIIENPQVHYDVEFDVIEYQRGVFKIAYELAWYWLGDGFLDDPEAAKLRKSILDSVPLAEQSDCHGIERYIRLGGTIDAFTEWNGRSHVHMALAMRTESKITVAIRIFDKIYGHIVVSNSAGRYPGFASGETLGQFIEIDPISKTDRQSPLSTEILRLVSTDSSAGPV